MIRYPSFSPDAPPPMQAMRGSRLADWVDAAHTYAVFEHQVARGGERPALTHVEHGTPEEIPAVLTYGELRSGIARAANVLLAAGARRGIAVGLLLPNCVEHQFLFWGAQAAAAAMPLNHLLEARHIAALLRAADARVLVAYGPAPGSDIWDKALAVRDLLGDWLHCLIQVGGTPDPAAGIVQYHEASAAAADVIAPSRLPALDDIAAVFHTGGTTGAPKLVRHTHRNELAAAFGYACMAELTPRDVCTNGFPMFHVAGAICLSLATYVAGAHLVNLSAAGFRNPEMVANHWRIVERHGVTVTAAVATALASIAAVAPGGSDLSSLRLGVSGGALVPHAVAARFEAVARVPLHEIYGMTETSAILCVEPARSDRVLGSAGFAAPFVELEVRDILPDGRTGGRLAPGRAGALVVRGENVMPGYKDAAHDRSAFTEDGWLVTGDLARLAADGRVTLTGRSKDLIIRSGHNIDPQVIEEAAMRHPAVLAAAAVGEPDLYAGELPVCYVVLRAGAGIGTDALEAFIAQRVPERPARPRLVYAIESMPVTGVGKVFKPALRRDAACRAVSRTLAQWPVHAVEAHDDGMGGFSVRVSLRPGEDADDVRRQVGERLAGFHFQWQLA
ncbi:MULTISPECIES: AMP-binding protein [Cupriavidus]